MSEDRQPKLPARRTLVRAVLALSGWVALAATALPGGAPLRWAPVLLFVCFGPGLALLYPQTGLLRPGARLETAALAAPLGLSLSVVVATTLFLLEGFSGTAFLVSLAAFTTLAAALPGLPLPAATRGAVERGRATSVGRR
ncbi:MULTISPECIES: hypothetical protein [Streptomyces]|uniref:DUF1616 domain-containing protein n=1 Tax=Streptomyces glycanivorans TaxID=3033808 RepID=A0ABY9JED5_9ACTN|nr:MULTISPECIES: hypothetical protein [unclassified Streptomyces]WLQ66008.1 hypothetical protein P8A20_21575 [Streptomyces sp. Alt3]WSQ79448.1 hypothetical protein OG725_21155 [Streptomyces sp. NBC_01213]WSR07154.1 hypothetical protein OG265_14580 [Streptomyces sp. NBC_01208]WSR50104.1 hypothetical protein OG279_21840 [Streptomyces sp. NBC_01201]